MNEQITLGKKLRVFAKNNGRIIIGGTLILVVVFVAIFAPLLTPYDPNYADAYNDYLSPSPEHPLGTDGFGRDVWARIAYGARTSLVVAVSVQLMMIALGVTLGLICGFYPKADIVIMRILEAISSIPMILLIFVISFALGEGFWSLMVAMVIEGVTGCARHIRQQVMSLRQKEFVEREIAMGAGTLRIMFLHVLPQCSSYLLVTFGSGLAGRVLSMATLSFLGVGLPPSIPNWGADISSEQIGILIHPLNVFAPMAAIAVTAFGFSLLGDGLRDLLDPKTRKGR